MAQLKLKRDEDLPKKILGGGKYLQGSGSRAPSISGGGGLSVVSAPKKLNVTKSAVPTAQTPGLQIRPSTNIRPKVELKGLSRVGRPLVGGFQRSVAGLGEDVSGFVDLITPGTGTSQITKNFRTAGALKDIEQRQTRGAAPGLYKAGQFGGEVAQVVATGGIGQALKVPKLANIGGKITGTGLAARTGRFITRPDVVANIAEDVVRSAGFRQSRGIDQTPLAFGADVAFSLGVPAAGVGASRVIKRATDAPRLRVTQPEVPSINARVSQELVAEGIVKPDISRVSRRTLGIGSDAITEGLDEARVNQIISDIQAGRPIEPVVVTRENGELFVQDGAHRLAAADQLGIDEIPVVEKIDRVRRVDTQDPLQPQDGTLAQEVAEEIDRADQAIAETPSAVTAEPDAPRITQDVQVDEPLTVSRPDQPTTASTKADDISDLQARESREIAAEVDEQNRQALDKLDDNFKASTNEYLGTVLSAETQARAAATVLPDIPKNKRLQAILSIDTGIKTGDPQIDQYADAFKAMTDKLYERYTQSGMSIGYVDTYLPRIYKDPAGNALTRQEFELLQLGSARQKSRSAADISLDDLIYDNPTDLLGHYVRNMEKALAGRKYFNDLEKSGHIVKATDRPPGLKLIDAEGFVEGDLKYYASPKVADGLNKIFGTQQQNKFLRRTARLSSLAQEIGLSAGIPGTPANSFTFAQLTKELASGNVKGPYIALKNSFRAKDAAKYLSDNADIVTEMQKAGIPVSSEFNLKAMRQLSGDLSEADKGLGRAWDKMMGDPTFKRFMPILQVETYKAARDHAGEKVAQDVVKNFYGLTDLATLRIRDRNVNNLVTSVFFAPRFRESMGRFWLNNIKAVRDPLNPANRQNVRFIGGATVMFGLMQGLNMALNGVPTWENPEGKKDKLLIQGAPGVDGKVLGLPFLSSIATVPRNLGLGAFNTVTGRPEEAGKNAASFVSYLGRPVLDVLNNEDYFGNQIVNEEASAGERIGKQAGFLTRAYMHPYIREAANIAANQLPEGARKFVGARDIPLSQSAAQALESPLRFYDPEYFEGQSEAFRLQGEQPTPDTGIAEGLTPITDETVRDDRDRVVSRNRYDAIKNAYYTRDGESNIGKYDNQQLKKAIDDTNQDIVRLFEENGFPLDGVNLDSNTARDYAYFQDDAISDINRASKNRNFARKIYDRQVSKDVSDLRKLNDSDIRTLLNKGELTEELVNGAVEYDNFLYENGIIQSPGLGKTIRGELGVDMPPSYTTGTSRRGTGRRARTTKPKTLKIKVPKTTAQTKTTVKKITPKKLKTKTTARGFQPKFDKPGKVKVKFTKA
jgi:hypothetical protein